MDHNFQLAWQLWLIRSEYLEHCVETDFKSKSGCARQECCNQWAMSTVTVGKPIPASLALLCFRQLSKQSTPLLPNSVAFITHVSFALILFFPAEDSMVTAGDEFIKEYCVNFKCLPMDFSVTKTPEPPGMLPPTSGMILSSDHLASVLRKWCTSSKARQLRSGMFRVQEVMQMTPKRGASHANTFVPRTSALSMLELIPEISNPMISGEIH